MGIEGMFGRPKKTEEQKKQDAENVKRTAVASGVLALGLAGAVGIKEAGDHIGGIDTQPKEVTSEAPAAAAATAGRSSADAPPPVTITRSSEKQTIALAESDEQTIRLSEHEGQTITLPEREGQTIALMEREGQTIELPEQRKETIKLREQQIIPPPVR